MPKGHAIPWRQHNHFSKHVYAFEPCIGHPYGNTTILPRNTTISNTFSLGKIHKGNTFTPRKRPSLDQHNHFLKEHNPRRHFNTFALEKTTLEKTQPFFENDCLLFSRIKAIQYENGDGKEGLNTRSFP